MTIFASGSEHESSNLIGSRAVWNLRFGPLTAGILEQNKNISVMGQDG